jgi:putative mycofactocin binding protein MftB
MNRIGKPRYVLAPGTQVRNEDFGLLFYTMKGPRLYFLSSGTLLDTSFFQGELTLVQWMRMKGEGAASEGDMERIEKVLGRLTGKGVIIEC